MYSEADIITFVDVTVNDLTRLRELMFRIYPPAYARFWPDGGQWYLNSLYNAENLERELRQPGATYQMLVKADRPLGIVRFLQNEPCPELPGRKAIKLHRLYFDRELHGTGVAGRLVQRLTQLGRRTGHDLLWLEAMDTAPRALAFYEKAGFRIVTPFVLKMPLMYPEKRGMYRMVKWLDDSQM